MSNSSLVVHTKISPNRTSPRNHVIDTISIHCVVGQATAESLGERFAKSSVKASSNYGVDKNGRVGMYVEEKDRSWCTSNASNDHRAITIEVASDATHPYAVNDKAYSALIDLLVDICKRNPMIGTLKWCADKSLIGKVDKQNMTVHRWFANKSCPGDYLYNLHYDIVEKVNARLGVFSEKTDGVYTKGISKKLSSNFQSTEFDCHGDNCCNKTLIDPKLVELLQTIREHYNKPITITSAYRCPTHNSKVSKAKNSYHTKGQAADFTVSGVKPREVAQYAESIGIKGIGLYETKSDGNFVHIDTRTTKSFWYGQAEKKVNTFQESTQETPSNSPEEKSTSFNPYVVRVSITNLNMRLGPSTSYRSIGYIPKGAYTIVEENGKWGRLKSKQKYRGVSVDVWIHLSYAKKLT